MKSGSTLTYLHGDHLGSTALATTSGGALHSSEQYFAYGKPNRLGAGTNLPTDNTYTGQKSDGSGLMYYNARYYDPQIGLFVSPDTIVPDAGLVSDYNRSMYTRGNPLKYNDPSGHCVTTALGIAADVGTGGAAAVLTGVEIGIDAACWAAVTEAVYLVGNMVMMWSAEAPVAADHIMNMADQASHSAAQNSGNGGNTGGGGGWDPGDPWGSFRNLRIAERHINEIKRYGDRIGLEQTYNQFNDLLQKGVNATGHAVAEAQVKDISTQRIVDTYNGTARGMQYFRDGSRVIQFSPYTKVAAVIEETTRELVTVYERTVAQRGWQPMGLKDMLNWLGQ